MFGLRRIKRLLRFGNVCITGAKGSGKDVIQGNVIARIKGKYISNVNYTCDDRYIPLNLMEFDCGGNTYENFITGVIKKYVYPYDDHIHVFISDAGNYFPSQYNSALDKKYGYFASWASLQRQLGESSLCYNTQAYERVWNKIREQCTDNFIRCNRCYVFFGDQGKYFQKLFFKITKHKWKFGGFVFGSYYYYDKADSCAQRVKPCRIRVPLFASKELKLQVRMYRDKFYNQHGTVKKYYYFFVNRSKHDSRAFKHMLENGI